MLRKAYSSRFYVIYLASQQCALPFLNYNCKLLFIYYHISSQDLLLANSTMARHVCAQTQMHRVPQEPRCILQ